MNTITTYAFLYIIMAPVPSEPVKVVEYTPNLTQEQCDARRGERLKEPYLFDETVRQAICLIEKQ